MNLPGLKDLRIAKPFLGPAMSLIAVSMVTNLLMLAGPLFMLQIYDRVLASRSLSTLLILTGLIVVIYFYYALLDALRSRMTVRAANALDARLADPLYSASVRLQLVPGALANVDPVRDGDVLRNFIGGSGPLALLDLPWMPVYLLIVFLMHPLLGWLALIGAITIIVLAALNDALSQSPSQHINSIQGQRQRQTEDTRANAETIIGMGMLDALQYRRSLLGRRLIDMQTAAADRTYAFSASIRALRFLLQSLVLAVGAYLVIQNQLSAGLMIAASIVTSRSLAPIDQLVGQWRGFVAARQAYARIRKILELTPDVRRTTMLPLPRSTLSVQALVTAPKGSRNPVLTNVSFDLAAGEALGVLGNSAAGKSSLARALVGVWPALSGSVRLDGALLGHYDPSQMSRIIGYLPQRVELFDGTVAENIARFQPDATAEAVIAAARAAHIHDLINGLPNGYDTPIGERGELLSAGQRQRIGLARALYGDPFLVVLDEPNSNLDMEGDAAVTEAVNHVRASGGVAIVIAHRPSALAAVDKLLVLQKGRQVSYGPKTEVLETMNRPATEHVLAKRAQTK